MINKIIRNFVAKQVAGRSDDGIMITLKDPQKVEFQTAMMQELLMRRGIDPMAIQSEEQLNMIINRINAMEKAEAAQSGIRNTESAKVFDLEGQEIKNTDNIMGGKELKFDSDQPPPGSRGGADDIAAPVQSSEESLRDMMIAENKKAVDNLKQKMAKEKSRTQRISGNLRADNAQRIEIGKPKLDEDEYNYYREILGEDPEVDYYPVKGDETKELLEAMVKEQNDEMAYMKRLYDKGALDDPEKKAYGGRIGLKVGTGKRFLQRVFGKERFKEMKSRDPEMYVGLLEVVDMYRKRDKEGLKMYLQKFLPHMDDAEIEDFIRGSDGTEGLIGELIRLGSGRDYAGKLEMIKRAQEMRKLDDLEVTDEMIRKPNADGGIMRLGLKEGSGMSRRTFLKLFSGLVSLPIIGKVLKPLKVGKTVTKVPIIKTDDVPGKPEWFDQLVNKVILEGDDVSKRFATKDREIVHMKVLDEGTGGKEFPPGTPGSDDTSIIVTQDLDEGAVKVEYRSTENMYGDPVQLRYKKPNPDEGDPRPSAEFDTAESIPVARADGPDDYSIDIDEGSGQSIKDLTSDVSKLKEYAMGKKPTLKEFVQSKKRKDRAKAISEGGENEMDEVIKRQGEFIENDLVDLDPPELASGGIARMLGE